MHTTHLTRHSDVTDRDTMEDAAEEAISGFQVTRKEYSTTALSPWGLGLSGIRHATSPSLHVHGLLFYIVTVLYSIRDQIVHFRHCQSSWPA